MKKFFAVPVHSNVLNFWLLILRICVALFMLTHGYPKLEKLMHGNFQFADPLGIGPGFSLFLVTFAEFFCSILLALGLATRFALIPLIITMGVVAFQVSAGKPFDKRELSLLYLVLFITLYITGPGKYSIDKMIAGSKRK